MKQDRRQFIRMTGMAAAGLCMHKASVLPKSNRIKNKTAKMKLSWAPYTLELKHTFTISNFSRTTTPVVLTRIEYDGMYGYGEASLPPYLGETQASVIDFLRRVDLSQFSSPDNSEEIINYVDSIAINNTAAKASIDIALHDLIGKMINAPWYKIYGWDKYKSPETTFTIGIDNPEVVKEKTKEALGLFRMLKVKLGSDNDKQIIEAIRSVTNIPLQADANQGWKDRQEALDMIMWLHEKGVVMLEQPLNKTDLENTAWLTERSPIPIFADESVQRLHDVQHLKGVFSGINIKLMKCTGMREAWKMRNFAETIGMKVMIGCMTETSCAISAAAQLSAGLSFADLDGALLISNDCYDGAKLAVGKMIASDLPGIGITPNKKIKFES